LSSRSYSILTRKKIPPVEEEKKGFVRDEEGKKVVQPEFYFSDSSNSGSAGFPFRMQLRSEEGRGGRRKISHDIVSDKPSIGLSPMEKKLAFIDWSAKRRG